MVASPPPGEFSEDLRSVTRRGGREGDVFYRDRWSHDKVVRSTHGVKCTGSCSWKIYVKDPIITWKTQETDYPSDRIGLKLEETFMFYLPRICEHGLNPSCVASVRVVAVHPAGACLQRTRRVLVSALNPLPQ